MKEDRQGRAVIYMVDDRYLKAERRRSHFKFLAFWCAMQVAFWTWHSVSAGHTASLTLALLLDSVWSLGLWLCIVYGGRALIRRMSVQLSESHIVVDTGRLRGPQGIRFSREFPLVIGRDGSGENWVISSGESPSKVIKVRRVLFPSLDEFVTDVLRTSGDTLQWPEDKR
jgi:hypothetical protein